MRIDRLFTEHPASIGETYGRHFWHAACFGTRMIVAGAACLVHAVFPFLCEKTGSKAVAELNDRMVVNRANCPPPDSLAAKSLTPRSPV